MITYVLLFVYNTLIMEFYNIAADDFSRTRYKIWNGVKCFLNSIPSQSLILDAGCGNGKNMLESNHNFIGIDTCDKLLDIVRKRSTDKINIMDLINASVTNLPFEKEKFDAVISIAVIHHLESNFDRLKAFDELIRVCKTGGKILITLWKLEDKFFINSKAIEGHCEGDRLVPWKLEGKILDRFYHFYTIQEVREMSDYLIKKYNVRVDVNEENYNYYIIIIK